MATIAVLGMDEENYAVLRRLPGDHDYQRLMEFDELLGRDHIDLPHLLEEADSRLRELPRPVDAVVGYWDFPVSSMTPILCKRHGLRSASLESVVRCEHKYWSRLEQQQATGDLPAFGVIDLDEDHPGLPPGVDFPVWVKPVKSASSALAFHVEDQAGLDEALGEIHEGIDAMGEPFQFVLDQVEQPEEIARAGAQAVLVEEAVSGRQVTAEGYEYEGDVCVYAVIDSHTYPNSSSFLRYQHPSSLPEDVRRRIVDSTERVIRQVGLTSSTFNIEYFWDPDQDRLAILEVNPRHSQSHAWMLEQVDGVANHLAMVRLALGEQPDLPSDQGRYRLAAKCFHRHFADGVVTRAPSREDADRIEAELAGVHIKLVAGHGDRLADLSMQDSYSYELAQVHVAADTEEELTRTYEEVIERLDYEIDEAAG